MDFDQLAQLYCWDMDKKRLDFGYLDLIFKVTQGLRMLVNGFLLNMHKYIVGTCQEVIKFW